MNAEDVKCETIVMVKMEMTTGNIETDDLLLPAIFITKPNMDNIRFCLAIPEDYPNLHLSILSSSSRNNFHILTYNYCRNL